MLSITGTNTVPQFLTISLQPSSLPPYLIQLCISTGVYQDQHCSLCPSDYLPYLLNKTTIEGDSKCLPGPGEQLTAQDQDMEPPLNMESLLIVASKCIWQPHYVLVSSQSSMLPKYFKTPCLRTHTFSHSPHFQQKFPTKQMYYK